MKNSKYLIDLGNIIIKYSIKALFKGFDEDDSDDIVELLFDKDINIIKSYDHRY